MIRSKIYKNSKLSLNVHYVTNTSKHLTFMKSLNTMISVIIIVPMRHREKKYIFHCHTTYIEKPGT